MENIDLQKSINDMSGFLEKFVLFHLGRDANVDIKVLPEEKLECSISHIRIEDIHFELDPGQINSLAQDIPAFEDFLLELLTRNRKGLSIDD